MSFIKRIAGSAVEVLAWPLNRWAERVERMDEKWMRENPTALEDARRDYAKLVADNKELASALERAQKAHRERKEAFKRRLDAARAEAVDSPISLGQRAWFR